MQGGAPLSCLCSLMHLVSSSLLSTSLPLLLDSIPPHVVHHGPQIDKTLNMAGKKPYYDKIKSDLGKQKWNRNNSPIRHIPRHLIQVSTPSCEGPVSLKSWHKQILRRAHIRAGKMEQQIKIFATKTDNLWTVPEPHRMEGVNWSLWIIFWSLHTCNNIFMCVCMFSAW